MKKLHRSTALVCTLALAACAQPTPAPDTREADAASIRDAVSSWSAAAQARDADAFMAVYTPDAVLMLEAAPDLRGVEAIHEVVTGMMQDPNFDLSFTPDEIEVARSGDLAYETGSYRLTMSGPEGSPAQAMGHYVVVWEKQADGTWKVVLDAPVTDPPQTPSGGEEEEGE